ncbi:MAG: tRNA pseudouridine(55) synthase TruB [Flavobacteriaceae bacterium CG2_30_34_30]|nr:tRNA pseudouridine(55) synthase TruB [Flavobacteriia bacterium]OIP51227.1 MAG: tRNA pseudouridine(55) synthase TruB [Flavobacteriaceae bacterium CG2_30_34_30]PIV50667.1 MAG: tRNA pseudouridine(55) synthase TruB [Flavobacteriaceae bacterium CG02_land_8_20_14_3_00_34_13]
MSKENYQEGKILLIDKPLNWTSFQVVNKVRWLIRKQFQLKKIKVGHAGTLDPLATGLLLICTGKFTKQIDTYQGQEKEYTGTFILGATTPSFDMETEIDQRFDIANLTKEKIKTVLPKFLGEIQQQPPVFSALKKDGKRLYEYARSGEEVEVAFRTVEISLFELTRIELPEIDFKVRCSKGTYIRSLAQDFGKVLDNGAYLSALRRTKIGDFSIKNAITMETFEKELTSSLS